MLKSILEWKWIAAAFVLVVLAALHYGFGIAAAVAWLFYAVIRKSQTKKNV